MKQKDLPHPYRNTGGGYWLHIAVAIDELANVVLLNGFPHQTISEHCALAAQAGKRWGTWACRQLDWLISKGHCAACLVPDKREGTD